METTKPPPTDSNSAGGPGRFHRRDLLESKTWIPLALICVLGCLLRLSGFDDYCASPDEGIYYSMVTWESWSDAYREYIGNAHPPLYYLLLRLLSVLSTELWPLRGIALVFGCCCVPATFLFARECVGRGPVATLTGLIAALWIAVSFTAIEMSQIIRPYTMQIACVTFGLFYLVRFLRDGAGRALPLYATLMVLATLTHYSTILVFAGTGLALLGHLAFRSLERRQIRSLVIWNLPILAAIAIVYLWHIRPDLEDSEMAVGTLTSWMLPLMIDSVTDIWPRFLGMLSSGFLAAYEGPFAIAFVTGIGVAIYRKNTTTLLFSMCLLAAAVAAAAAHKYPFGCSRHSLYLAGIVAVPIALAIATGLSSGLRTAIPTAVAIVGLAVFHSPVSTGLGSPNRVRAFENRLSRADFAQVTPLLNALKGSPGIILMAKQAYYQLMPEYHRERQGAMVATDASVRRFRWGQREVVVSEAWAFSVRPTERGQPKHLLEVIQNIDRHMPELEFGKRTNVTVFIGSWSSFRHGIGALGKLVRRTRTVPGFLIAELDIAGFRALEAKADK